MLYLITGRIGSGKSTHIRETIKAFAGNGIRDMTLIVPEQFSFATERMMLRELGPVQFGAVSVLSFSRLADRLVPVEYTAGKIPADEASRAAMMGLALESVQDKLQLYGKQVKSPTIIQSFLSLNDELRQSCVTPERLREAAADMEPCRLQRKLWDIALVEDAFAAEESRGYFDTADTMDYLCDMLRESHYFAGKLVFIDAFRGFTAQELRVIECMLRDAAAVYVTLCMEKPGECRDDDLFAHTKVTEKRLKALARKNNVGIIKPQNLSMGNKFNNFPKDMVRYRVPELGALEQNLFDPAAPVYEQEATAITLCSAPDMYAECDYVAAMAKRLMREKGYRCRDMAVIARYMDKYEAPLRAALAKCGVSVFEDKRQSVTASPLIAFTQSALAIAAHGCQSENIFRFLKTGLTPLSYEETADLENYTYLWQINGNQWRKEWSFHPRGFGFAMESEDKAELERINALRVKALQPLENFDRRLNGASGAEAAAAILALLEKTGVPERLKNLAIELKAQGETEQANEQEQLWNTLMHLLDCIESAMGERNFSAAGWEHMFDLMLRTQTVGTIPQGLDEVVLGSADRIRLVSPKVVFIVGANYGVFPAVPEGGSALNDRDRKVLAEKEIELAAFGEYKLAEEKLIAYSSFCAAKELLFVTYPARDAAGSEAEPSELVTRIRSRFPKCRRCDTTAESGLFFVESPQTAFEQMAREKNADSLLYRALREYFGKEPAYAGRLAALERAGKGRDYRIADTGAAVELFGKNMKLSASRIEKYNKCHFAYFCEYGMKAKVKKAAQIDVLQRGTIIHYVLENLLRRFKGDSLLALSRQDRLGEITALLEVYLNEFLGGSEDKTPRFMHNYRLLAGAVNDIAERLVQEFAVCDFRPVDFELAIGDEGKIPAYELPLADGGTLKVQGSIDRVDAAVIDGESYLRVIDYKSGGKDFALSDVLHGLNMQMLVYLFALWKNGGEYYGPITPAGVLYYPAKAPTVSVERNADDEKIQQEKLKKCKMKGIVLNESKVAIAMDREVTEIYVPVKYSEKKGIHGDLITVKQLAALMKRVEKLMCEMADSLKEGQIEAVPVKTGKAYEDVCKYCDYKAVCFYENTMERRVYESRSLDEVLEELDGEAENNG